MQEQLTLLVAMSAEYVHTSRHAVALTPAWEVPQ